MVLRVNPYKGDLKNVSLQRVLISAERLGNLNDILDNSLVLKVRDLLMAGNYNDLMVDLGEEEDNVLLLLLLPE